MTRVVLWDIDGTLADVHGNGRLAFALAIERTWGIKDDLADIRFAGATDLGILDRVRERRRGNGAGGAGDMPIADHARFFDVMHDVLVELLASSPATALGGGVRVVSRLHERGYRQGLVTGNARRCAYVKLASAGYDAAHFPVGGFGDEHHDRDELAVRALAAMSAPNAPVPVDAGSVALVGDTPSDIRAAKKIGARAIGVVCRAFTRAHLLEAGADDVVDDVAEVEDLV